jgi:ubiquinone/menaquinone biosynthesis C-methylase UbiE
MPVHSYKFLRPLYEQEALARKNVLSLLYAGRKLPATSAIPFWARYFLRLKQEWLEKALIVNAPLGAKILDVGCGCGYLAKNCFSEQGACGARIFNLDVAYNYLTIAKQAVPFQGFIQADAEHLPFKQGSFDVVVCSEVLEHIPDLEDALAQIKQVTKKIFISTVPVLPRVLDDVRVSAQKNGILSVGKGHLRHFQVKSYLNLLQRHGFTIKAVQGMGSLFWLWGWNDLDTRFHCLRELDYQFSGMKICWPLVLDVGVIAQV